MRERNTVHRKTLSLIKLLLLVTSYAMETNSNCNKGFADSYMLLKPEKAGFFDLLRVLIFRNISQRKFVESHADGDLNETLGHRWLIFISILAQRLLQLVAKPLSLFGTCVELLINLISLNGGVFRLLPNFIKGFSLFLTSLLTCYRVRKKILTCKQFFINKN